MIVSTFRRQRTSSSLRFYAMTLTLSSTLYFIRFPETSIYVFDTVWLAGMVGFPRKFFRMPRMNYFALILLTVCMASSLIYASLQDRLADPIQPVIILMRFTQMVVTANFFINCANSEQLLRRDFVGPAQIALFIPICVGLLLYWAAPDYVVVFNRYAGYFSNPNSMALFLVVSVSVFLTIMKLYSFPKMSNYALLLTFFGLAAYSLLLTGSNSGLILFTAIVVLYSISHALRHKVFLSLTVAGALIATLVFENYILSWAEELLARDFIGWQRTGRLIINISQGLGLSELGSLSYRESVENYLFGQQLSEVGRVFLGLGPGQSKSYVFGLDGNSVTIHNFYKLIFLEYGLIGFGSFLALAVVTFKRFRWNVQTLLLSSGYLVALLGTPLLYLPFFWVPLFSVWACFNYQNIESRKMSLLLKTD